MKPNKNDDYIKSFYANRKSKNISCFAHNHKLSNTFLFYNYSKNGYYRVNDS